MDRSESDRRKGRLPCVPPSPSPSPFEPCLADFPHRPALRSSVVAPRSPRAVRLTAIALGLLVPLAVAELVVRLTWRTDPGPKMYESADKRLGLECYPDDPRGDRPVFLRRAGSFARWSPRIPGLDEARALRPHCIEFRWNSHGWRGDEPRAGVFVVGDSFTEGQGVREEDAFTARLAERGEWRVVGAGRRGLDFPRLERELTNVPGDDPLVLYALVPNDAERSPEFDARFPAANDFIVHRGARAETAGLGEYIRLYEWMRRRLATRRLTSDTLAWYRGLWSPANPGAERTFSSIARVEASLRARGGRFAVALLPLLVREDGRYPLLDLHAQIATRLRAMHIPVIDLGGLFANEDPAPLWVAPTDMHPNARAHARIAEALAAPLRDLAASDTK